MPTTDTDAFVGRVALVTGAAGGLGSALSQALAQRGATVAACDVDEAGLGRLAQENAGAPNSIRAFAMDLADPASIERELTHIKAACRPVDILIHAAVLHIAGRDGSEPRAFIDHTPSQVLATLAVSVVGPTLLTQLVCRGMAQRKSGRIVLLGSMHHGGSAGLVMYAAAKSYVNALARGLFLELRELNILTLVANPGGMDTGLHARQYPWMMSPDVVAGVILEQIALPGNVALLSFELVPHDVEHPDGF